MDASQRLRILCLRDEITAECNAMAEDAAHFALQAIHARELGRHLNAIAYQRSAAIEAAYAMEIRFALIDAMAE